MQRYGVDERTLQSAEQYDELHIGRVLSQEKDVYRVACENGELAASVSGKLRFEAASASEFPAVGDFVMLDRDSDAQGRAVIHHVLPRKSVFIRKAAGSSREEQVVAANVDTLFICMSLNNDFNLRRLERYLAIGWDSGAIPVVVLTKADLCDDIAEKLEDIQRVALGAEVLVTSSLELDGLDKLGKYITDGKTVALIGSSGVGKSTLINRLLGEERLSTNGLRNDDKGRHTTTRRELVLLERGGMVIDTPGMRELGMWDAADGLTSAFADIEALVARCRFSDCGHNGEPGCAVLAAINAGELDEQRWLSYKKLKSETARAQDSEGFMAAKEKKFKSISKINKANRNK